MRGRTARGRFRRQRAGVSTAVVMTLVLLNGCGGDDPPPPPARVTTPVTPPTTPPTTPPVTPPVTTSGPATDLNGDDDQGLVIPPAHWTGLAGASPGDSIAAVQAALGTTFRGWTQLTETCGHTSTVNGDFGVIATGQGELADPVQAFIIRTPEVRMVDTDIGVGNTLDEVYAAYPNWAARGGTNESGGDNVYIAPSQWGVSPDVSSTGRGALFEANPSGVIVQYRVGSAAYAFHTRYCYSPDE